MSQENYEKFAILLTRHEPDLRRYVYSLLGNRAEADDVMQETSLALWRKFGEYDAEQPFIRWAMRFAYWEVKRHRKSETRRKQRFSDETLQLLAEEYAEDQSLLSAQRRILGGCMKKLPEDDRSLLELRYSARMTVPQICDQTEHEAKRLYRTFDRIRDSLMACVTKQMAQEGWT